MALPGENRRISFGPGSEKHTGTRNLQPFIPEAPYERSLRQTSLSYYSGLAKPVSSVALDARRSTTGGEAYSANTWPSTLLDKTLPRPGLGEQDRSFNLPQDAENLTVRPNLQPRLLQHRDKSIVYYRMNILYNLLVVIRPVNVGASAYSMLNLDSSLRAR